MEPFILTVLIFFGITTLLSTFAICAIPNPSAVVFRTFFVSLGILAFTSIYVLVGGVTF